MSAQYEDIFRYHFESLYSMTKQFVFCTNDVSEEEASSSGEFESLKSRHLFDSFESAYNDLDRLSIGYDEYRHWIEIYVYKIVINMMKRASITFSEIYRENCNEKNSVIYTHGSKRIQAYFLYDISYGEAFRTPYDEIADSLRKEAKEVDKIRVYVFRDSISFPSLAALVNACDNNQDHFVEVCSLKEFFLDFFSEKTYLTFIDYVQRYCEKSSKLIALRTVIVPTNATLSAFRDRKKKMLDDYDYRRIMNSGIVGSLNEKEFESIKENCISNNMFSAMVGKSNFAESFISAEWSYDVYSNAMGELEKTGIIAGYLKSIEQLLATVVGFHKDQGFIIRTKNRRLQPYTSDNLEMIDSTLGSLKEFVKKANLPLSANIRGCFTISLENWLSDRRNGYFHKDNIFCSKKVTEVRETTLFLYFIILGGLKYSRDEISRLGVRLYNQLATKNSNEEGLQKQFKSWLARAIEYDTDNETPFYYFSIHDNDVLAKIYVHKIHSFSIEDFESEIIDLRWIRNSYDSNHVKKWPTLSWERDQGENENLLVQVLKLVSSFSKEKPDLINKVGGIVGSYRGEVMLLHKKKGS